MYVECSRTMTYRRWMWTATRRAWAWATRMAAPWTCRACRRRCRCPRAVANRVGRSSLSRAGDYNYYWHRLMSHNLVNFSKINKRFWSEISLIAMRVVEVLMQRVICNVSDAKRYSGRESDWQKKVLCHKRQN